MAVCEVTRTGNPGIRGPSHASGVRAQVHRSHSRCAERHPSHGCEMGPPPGESCAWRRPASAPMCASEVGADDRAGSLSVTCPAPTCTDTGGIGDPLTLRRGEIFALRWKDIDGQKRLLTVREASTTARSVRTKPKQDYDRTWQLLADWKTQAGNTAPDAMVFATRRGTPILPNNVLRRAIFPAGTRLGLPKATWLTF
jgi:hypothetical protein